MHFKDWYGDFEDKKSLWMVVMVISDEPPLYLFLAFLLWVTFHIASPIEICVSLSTLFIFLSFILFFRTFYFLFFSLILFPSGFFLLNLHPYFSFFNLFSYFLILFLFDSFRNFFLFHDYSLFFSFRHYYSSIPVFSVVFFTQSLFFLPWTFSSLQKKNFHTFLPLYFPFSADILLFFPHSFS